MNIRTIATIVSDVRTSLAVGTGLPPAVRRQLYAQLGTIRFEIVGAITGLDSDRTFTFAQHDVIEGKPRLQAMGDALEVLTLTLSFREQLGDPVGAFADLVTAAARHLAMPFVFSGGQVLGRYVVTKIGDTIDRTDGGGRVTQRTVKVTLTEFEEGAPLEVASRARRADAKTAVVAAKKTAVPGVVIRGGDPHSVPTSVLVRGRP